jgi:hypothetical protein
LWSTPSSVEYLGSSTSPSRFSGGSIESRRGRNRENFIVPWCLCTRLFL